MAYEVADSLELADIEQVNALLLGVIQATAAGPEVEPLAGAVARLISQATTTDACFVHVLDDAGTSITLAGATPPFDELVGTVRLRLGTGVTGWVATHRKPAVIVEDKFRDSRYVAVPALRGSDYTSMASVPMASDPAGLVGVLNVHTRERREFTSKDVQLLTTIGNLVAGSMNQARLHRQLTARERAHEQFAEQVVAAQESERRRLAADIHDGITQRLVSLTYYLDAAAHAPRGEAPGLLRSARELAALSIDEARIAIGGLRPPVLDDLGLSGGLASLAASVPGLEVEVDAAGARLPEHVEIALYRIAQEALSNVLHHAAAGAASVRFSTSLSSVELRVEDNGRGLGGGVVEGDRRGYGITSMTERAELVGGSLVISARPGGGTAVTATIPLDARELRWPGPPRPRGTRARDGGFLP